MLLVSFRCQRLYIYKIEIYIYKQQSPLFHYKILDKYQTLHLLPITTLIMFTPLKLSTIAAAIALPVSTMGWAVTFYSSAPCNSAPGSDWSYWVYEGTGQSPCIDIGTAPPAGVTCLHQLNGGSSYEDCGGGFVPHQVSSFFIRSGDCVLSEVGSGCYAGFGSRQNDCQDIPVDSFSCNDG